MVCLFLGFPSGYGQNVDVISGNTSAISKHQDSIQKKEKKKKDGSIVPVPIIITDQNLGYGAVINLVHIHKKKNSTRENTPPTMTGISGGYTSTGTWVVGGGHSESFKNDQYRYTGVALYANVNMDFYSISDFDLSDHPFGTNIKTYGMINRFLFRLGQSNFFLGPQYMIASVEATLNIEDTDHPIIEDIIDYIDSKTTLSNIALIGNYDNRDNTISPTKGIYTGFDVKFSNTFLGASDDYGLADIFFYDYVPLTNWLYSIYNVDMQFSDGDTPFYLKPQIVLRGVPAMRYQGDHVLTAQAQFRGNVYKNWSLVAFGGLGKAFDDFDEFGDADLIVNYGTGFRHNFKKVFGLRAGADFAWTNKDQFGWYISIGTNL